MARNPADNWLSLTWDDVEGWAGTRSVERGRTYQRGGRVRELAVTTAGELLATVRGTMKYTTSVALVAGKKGSSLRSNCSCPVGLNCKHAVAVIAEYLDAVAHGRAVATTDGDDPRWADLDDDEGYDEEGYDEYEDEGYDDEYEPPPRPARTPKGRSKKSSDADTEQYIRGLSQGELADLVVSLTHRYPDLRTEFKERLSLMTGDAARIVAEARKEIRRVTAEPSYSYWDDYGGGPPDYGPIRHRLERLVELGHPDEVVPLGRELIREGQRQLEMSNDEGESITAFAKVMPVIIQAVAASKLTGPQKLLFAIEAELADEFDAGGDSADELLNANWTKADWSAVADELAKRLTTRVAGEDSFTRDYRRDRVSTWVGKALANAGRAAEVDDLFEAEAKATGSYERLVKHLLERKRHDEAAEWAVAGISATAADRPGIAAHLAATLRDLAAGRKQWDVVAAHAAHAFFDRPSDHAFGELTKAAAKAGVEQPVREAALKFLETGAMPFRLATGKPAAKKPSAAVRKAGGRERAVPASGWVIDPDWPLPLPGYLEPLMNRRAGFDARPGPHLDVLLDLALKAKRPDEVLKWYDRMLAAPKQSGTYYAGRGYADAVAKAVADTHPQRTFDIYTAALNAQLPNADPRAYEAAAGYLKKLKPVYAKLKRAAEWDALVAGIREKYRNRPKFMEQLDKLQGQRTTIVDAARKKPK